MLFFKIYVCTLYGLVSIVQTLNSRYLFRTLQFSFYSSVFLTQRLVIILINWRLKHSWMPWRKMALVVPYSFIMCTINILSSYCVTIMPLAAFMAFKKFVVFFMLLVGLAMSLPNHFTRVHYCCILAIVVGGLMIGEKDIFRGEFIGYISSLIYTLFQALALQYSSHLYLNHGIGPQDLMVTNSLLSLPYYSLMIIWEGELAGISTYFTHAISPLFFDTLLFAVVLSFSSEYTANTISMKISPFEKASVSNIKDLVLTLVSIKYFKDFVMNPISEVGITFCLLASLVFSFTLIEQQPKPVTQESYEPMPIDMENQQFMEQGTA